jgi:hypothetical protein
MGDPTGEMSVFGLGFWVQVIAGMVIFSKTGYKTQFVTPVYPVFFYLKCSKFNCLQNLYPVYPLFLVKIFIYIGIYKREERMVLNSLLCPRARRIYTYKILGTLGTKYIKR